MAVLIFSMPGDLHTAAVEWSLRRKGVEIDKVYMPDFPQRGSISCEVNSSDVNFLVGDRKIRYKDYDTVWFRRFSSAVPSGLLAQGDLTAAKRSWIELSRFLIEFPRGNAFCLNPPESQAMRDNKVFQLGVARDCGLLIPLTLVGTNHEDLAAFITTNSRDGHETIVKPLVPTMWSRSDGTKVTLAVSIVTLGDLEEADVSSEPLIYQRRVQKAYEVRLTVDLPPSEWSKINAILDDEGDLECRARSIARKRLSGSCVKLRLCWHRGRRPLRRVAGSRSANRLTTDGARNMAA